MKKAILSRLLSEEKGQALILFALLSTFLIGITAFTVDVGYLQWQKRELQNAADAASLAGARALIDNEDVFEQVKSYVEANGFDESDIVNSIEINAILPTATEVPVSLRINRDLFFARVLGFEDSNVAALAVAEVTNLPGYPAFVSFDQDDGNVRFSGSININAGEQLVVHSNKNITVDGNAVSINPKPTGTYVGTLNDHPQFPLYDPSVRKVNEPIVSPLAGLNHNSITNASTLGDEINRLIGAGELVFMEGRVPTRYAYYQASTLFPPGPPQDKTLTVPDGGIGVIYINGNISSGTIPGNRTLNIETNGGLVIVNGTLITSGNQNLNFNGLIYATNNIELGGTVQNFNGGLWSEGIVRLHGNPTSFINFKSVELPSGVKVRLKQ